MKTALIQEYCGTRPNVATFETVEDALKALQSLAWRPTFARVYTGEGRKGYKDIPIESFRRRVGI